MGNWQLKTAGAVGLVLVTAITAQAFTNIFGHDPNNWSWVVLSALGAGTVTFGIWGYRMREMTPRATFLRVHRTINRVYRSSPNREDRYPSSAPSGLGMDVDLANDLVNGPKLRWRVLTKVRLPYTRLTHRRVKWAIREIGNHAQLDNSMKNYLFKRPTREQMTDLASSMARLSGNLPYGAEIARKSVAAT